MAILLSKQARPMVPYSFARDHQVILFENSDRDQAVLRTAQTAFLPLAEAQRLASGDVTVETITIEDFDTVLADLYALSSLDETADSLGDQGQDDIATLADHLSKNADLLASENDAPVIKLLNGLLHQAIRKKASDIHIEPYDDQLILKIRLDGHMTEMASLSARLASYVISRVKVMANLDIALKNQPQDGRFSLSIGAKSVDVRVSTLPSKGGERVVLRILEKDTDLLNLQKLGLPPVTLQALQNALQKPNGMLLISGPTGSGKTTTLYAALASLNDGSKNILTVEDPIEYDLNRISQTQINPQAGMTFARGLRSILRQDPDVVMVGEIRDRETADIAVRASLTGHVVLSTLHTNSAISTINRLRDMQIEPYLLASSLSGVMAQRLVRRLCDHCKQPHTPTQAECDLLGLTPDDLPQIYRSVGCSHCHHSGYEGRLGLYEFIAIDDQVKALFLDGASEAAIAGHVFAHSMTLVQHGVMRLQQGETTLDEIMRVCDLNAMRQTDYESEEASP